MLRWPAPPAPRCCCSFRPGPHRSPQRTLCDAMPLDSPAPPRATPWRCTWTIPRCAHRDCVECRVIFDQHHYIRWDARGEALSAGLSAPRPGPSLKTLLAASELPGSIIPRPAPRPAAPRAPRTPSSAPRCTQHSQQSQQSEAMPREARSPTISRRTHQILTFFPVHRPRYLCADMYEHDVMYNFVHGYVYQLAHGHVRTCT